MSSNESDEIEFKLRPPEADQSASLEPELESSRADDTRSTVEMKAEVAQPASDEENFERYQEELQTLLDPPAQKASAGANSRGAPGPTSPNLIQRLQERVDELEAEVKRKPVEEIPEQASLFAPPSDVKSEFRHLEHADHRSQSPSYIEDDEVSRQTVEDALPKDKMRFK